MNIDQLREYCLSKKEVTEDFPFDEDTLVLKVLGKIFIIIPLDNWERGEGSINLKCDPEYALELRESFDSIEPGFHMNKKHWNSIYLYKGGIDPEFLKGLIDHSYNMVVNRLPKKLRDQLK